MHTVLAWMSAHLALVAVTAAAALSLSIGVTRAVRKAASRYSPRADDVLTFAVAAVATAVAVSGMWRFFGVVLHLGGPERAMFCAVLELAVFMRDRIRSRFLQPQLPGRIPLRQARLRHPRH